MRKSLHFQNGLGEVSEEEINRQKWCASFRHGLLDTCAVCHHWHGSAGEGPGLPRRVGGSLMDTPNIRRPQDSQVEVAQ